MPALVLAIGIPLSRALEHADLSSPAPDTVEVGSRQDGLRTAVLLRATFEKARSVTAPFAGTVTAVLIEPRQDLSQGTPIVDIDYHRVAVFAMSSPLVRDLESGATGPDVGQLSAYLSALGYLSTADVGERFTWRVREAVKAFQRAYGHTVDGTFRPSYVVFVSSSARTVESVDLRVGDQVTTTTALFNTPREVAGLTIEPATTGVSLAPLADVGITVTAGAESFDLSSVRPEADELQPFMAWLQDRADDGSVEADQSEDDSVSYGGAIVELSAPETVGSVPGSAILVGESGTACVFVSRGSSFTVRVLHKAGPLSGEIGNLAIDADLVGAAVARDAAALPRSVRSGCE